MAAHAAFGLHGLMLEDERSLFVDVACEANRIPGGRRTELLAHEPAVGIMAIRALNEPFVHPVVERHVELRLDVEVAAVAKGRLALDQQKPILVCLVGRVAAQAAQVVLAVCRAGKVHVVFPRTVALQTALVNLLGRRCLEAENLLRVGVLGMSGTGSVTGFATVSLNPLLGLENAVPVARRLQSVEDVFVTGLAGVCSYILGLRWRLRQSLLRILAGDSPTRENCSDE